MPWPPEPEDPALVDAVVRAMRGVLTVAFSEHVSSGPGTGAAYQASMTGEQFVGQELYAAGGASGVRPWPGATGSRGLTFFVPGSYVWYSLGTDASGRILSEAIVSPGHLIERSSDIRPAEWAEGAVT